MASITTRQNGSRFITFVDANGRPQFLTLGKVPMRYAESVKVKVEDLVSSTIYHHPPRDDTARWVAGLDEKMVAKLARLKLTEPRRHTTLGGWLDQYLDEREGELKPESLRKLNQTRDKLLAFFDAGMPMRQITLQDAAQWRQFLKDRKLSEAVIKTHSGNVKTILSEAVRRKLIEENPFALLKSGPTSSRYSRYVTAEEIARVIAACPDTEWKVLFGLARYAGLRIPSESHLLTWADVDFERGRLTVRSPKTEHHAGHEQRFVPITPRLMVLLEERLEAAEEGEVHLVTIKGKGATRRQVARIWQRAGVEPWKRLWQTLRQSCEKEWAMYFPQYAVSKWIGHRITVSGRHYANDVPEELFTKAAGLADASQPTAGRDQQNETTDGAEDADSTPCAQRNAQQKAHENCGNGKQTKRASADADARNSPTFAEFRDISISDDMAKEWSRGESNPRAGTVSLRLLHA